MLLLDAILGAMLSSTWHQLGAILRAKSAPSWLQVAQKTDPTTNQKNYQILNGFLIDFWSILAPTWGVQGGSSNALLGVLLASWGQDSTSWPPDPSKRRFGSHVHQFFMDFGSHVCQFLMDLGSHLAELLVVWLVDWLIACLLDCLIGCLVDWLLAK